MPPPPPPPLEYHLKVNTTIPRPLQLRQLMTMMAAQAPSYTKAFLKPSRASYDLNPTNEDELVALATKDTSIIAWPIVVNWATGWCSVGNYKEVYRFLRKIAESRPLPKLEGTPIWDNDTLAKERVRGPTYLSGTLSDQDIEELEDITS
ncbi:hypothetical protein PsYK624_117760 [Phanerochaete sordida]|uniref:Uncharacterized protein n=1 Tax=Phanerochaete sordida TaxID=48140 RepID=A0A9P3LHQ9_9APHY|nr:hypothetical protein PsYK624_117760 [Phanerochaete sordida]